MDGIHLLGEWYGCPADLPEMTRADALRGRCIEAVERAGLTIVGDRFHQFEPQGVTGAVILAESHLAVHTWPEMGADNTEKAQRLFDELEKSLKPARTHFHSIHRGGASG